MLHLIAATVVVLLCANSAVAQPLKGKALVVRGMPPKTDNLSAVVVTDGRIVMVDDEQRSVLTGQLDADGGVTLRPPSPLTGPGKEEFDLEGLAAVGNNVYAVGSHSLARRSADGDRSQAKNLERMQEPLRNAKERKVMFRMPLDAASAPAQLSTALADILQGVAKADQPTASLFAAASAAPGKENGIDIEGLAAAEQSLWVGFRGPVLRHGYVPVLKVNAGAYPELKREELLFVTLGGRGIRDLARVTGGFLVLAGAVGDSDQSTQVVFWDGRSCVAREEGVAPCTSRVLGVVEPVTGVDGDGKAAVGRAEGLAVIEDSAARYRILIVFDGVQGGALSEFSVARTP